jgi:hypothetical protein
MLKSLINKNLSQNLVGPLSLSAGRRLFNGNAFGNLSQHDRRDEPRLNLVPYVIEQSGRGGERAMDM